MASNVSTPVSLDDTKADPCHQGLPDSADQTISPFILTVRKPLLCYLKTSASPRTSLKLMQIAKYFCFPEFPFTAIKNFHVHDSTNDDQGEYCLVGTDKYELINLKNFTKKLWITQNLQIAGELGNLNFYKTIVSKIAVCDVEHLCLYKQKLTIDEFKFFNADKLEGCRLQETIVTDSNEEVLPLEAILENLPNICQFNFHCIDETAATLTSDSTKNILEVLKNRPINRFSLYEIPQTFDADAFFEFITESPQIRFDLGFEHNISLQYAKKLQAYVDKLIEDGLETRCPLWIMFHGQSRESFQMLISSRN